MIEFYYSEAELIKANVKEEVDGKLYSVTYYFTASQLINNSGNNPEESPRWTVEKVKQQAAMYLTDSHSICQYLIQRRK
jgi:hypothetical protein